MQLKKRKIKMALIPRERANRRERALLVVPSIGTAGADFGSLAFGDVLVG